MARDWLLLAIGVAAGATLVHLSPIPGSVTASAPEAPESRGDSEGGGSAAALASSRDDAGGSAAAVRLALGERAALADEATLELEIERAAAAAPSFTRDVELDVLLHRLAELDPARAVRVAAVLGLGTRFVVPMYRIWAERDADAALDELARVTPPAMRRAVALAMLDAFGGDESAAERIAGRLAPIERAGFRIDALAARAEHDPAAVLAEVTASATLLGRSLLLPRIATAAARVDPERALELATGIGDPQLRTEVIAAAFRAWAERDAGALLAYLESAPPGTFRGDALTFQAIAAVDPERVLALGERMPPAERLGARSAALVAIAERDVSSALAYLETVPPGRDRERLLGAVASTYARRNPDEALAWAKSLSPPSQRAVSAVIEGIAAASFERALERVLLEIRSGATAGVSFGQALPVGAVFSAINAEPSSAPRWLDALLESNDPVLRERAEAGVYGWAQHEPARAVDWAIANLDQLGASSMAALAQRIATTDPVLASITPSRLTAEARAEWIVGAAEGIAASDPDGARAYLEPFREDPGYAEAATAVLRRTVLVRPAAAAEWAAELGHPPALAVVASSRARTEAAAARRWVLDLPPGEGRDAALSSYIAVASGNGEIDRELFGAFESDAARQQSAARAAVQIAVADREAARALLGEYVDDPELRRRIEEQLARGGGMPVAPLPRIELAR